MLDFTRTTTLATALAALLAGGAAAQEHTLNINTALAESDPLYAGLEAMRDNVAEASDGRLAIVLYPNSQLGPDEDVLEQARAGAPVAVVVDGGRLAAYQDEFGVLGAPFLASGYDGIRKVVTSDMFEGWVDEMAEGAGLQVLSFNWWQGERHLLTNVPVEEPADLDGIRMRTPGAPVWTGTISAMGATPTPLPWGEVYSALSSNVIDGAEAQMPAIVGANLQEVISHVTKTGHINLITGLVTSAGWFDSLPEDLQTILRDEALEAGDIASYGTRDSLAEIEEQLTEAGVTVSEVDTAPFREATAGVYDDLGYGDLRDELRAMAEE
ncbi:C4-dicarboxylate TRAP transporter substrate-binding protein [Roseivivax sediminis]|uniref:TRAP-type C4-dicarboxylate transport system, substrate-binding protein n=1 Tax=Roseivivax sediminis TaxID=936889 RepID=A0A1I2C2F0_9RHOB|nr:C4-dicarboxylate TRAP transporter substrate-binding protein [Roseivivax sediminis]SFE62338.1 TRAP-type C4-dicarboxylate transport system, substrate-binding protein [Roseivivax sediminis]